MLTHQVPSHCLQCPHHEVIADPDPDDWFCDDDKAVICRLTPNPEQKPESRYLSDQSACRAVTCSCRPYNLEKEATRPGWCPL